MGKRARSYHASIDTRTDKFSRSNLVLRSELIRQLEELLSIAYIQKFENLEQLGRWVLRRIRTWAKQLKLPSGFKITNVTLTFYSEPTGHNDVVMRVSYPDNQITVC